MPPLIDVLSPTTLAFIAFWSVLALVVVFLVLRAPSSLLLARSDQGRLEISREALHRVLETCCEQVRGIASARARVSRKGGLFHTELRLRIRPDARLDAIQGYLTEEIGEIYRQNLGVKEIGRIEIKVVGVAPHESGF